MAADIDIVVGVTGGSSIDRLTARMDRLERRTQRSQSVLRGAIEKITGPLGFAAIGAAAVLAVTKSIGAFVKLEDSLASLSAITGATGKDLEFFADSATELSSASTQARVDVVKAFELIGSAKPELLGSQEALVGVTKEVITLAEAARLQLPEAALALTGALNQFGAPAEQAGRFINVLAAGSKAGASPVKAITQSIKSFGVAAASSNISIEESVALVEVLGDKAIFAGEAGTALRNILGKLSAVEVLPPEAVSQLESAGVNLSVLSDNTIPFTDRLRELAKIQGNANALTKVFGEENKIAAQVLVENTDRFDELTAAVTDTNVAYEQQAIQANTTGARLKKLGNTLTTVFEDIGEGFASVFASGEVLNTFQRLQDEAIGFVATAFVDELGGIDIVMKSLAARTGATIEKVKDFGATLKIAEFRGLSLDQAMKKVIKDFDAFTTGAEKAKAAQDALNESQRAGTSTLSKFSDRFKPVFIPLGLLENKLKDLKEAFKLAGSAAKEADIAKQIRRVQVELDRRNKSLELTRAVVRGAAGSTERLEAALQKATERLSLVTPGTEAWEKAIIKVRDATISLNLARFNEDLERTNGKISDFVIKSAEAIAAANKKLQEDFRGGTGLVTDATQLPGRTVEDLALEDQAQREFDIQQQRLANTRAFNAEMKDLAKDLGAAFIQAGADIVESIGRAIGAGDSVADAFKQALKGLLVEVPKLAGIALLNAATNPKNSLIALELAVAGLALIGLSGLLGGLFSREDSLPAAAGPDGVPSSGGGSRTGLGDFSQSAETGPTSTTINLSATLQIGEEPFDTTVKNLEQKRNDLGGK